VLNNIHVLAKHVKRQGMDVPAIEDDLTSKNLFAASLIAGDGPLFPEEDPATIVRALFGWPWPHQCPADKGTLLRPWASLPLRGSCPTSSGRRSTRNCCSGSTSSCWRCRRR